MELPSGAPPSYTRLLDVTTNIALSWKGHSNLSGIVLSYAEKSLVFMTPGAQLSSISGNLITALLLSNRLWPGALKLVIFPATIVAIVYS
jgi:hypothetical protein